MALNLSLSIGLGDDNDVVAEQVADAFISITNTGAAAVTLTSLYLYSTSPSVSVGQPAYLIPNVPVGTGNPILAPNVAQSFYFDICAHAPNFPGVSANYGAGSPTPGGSFPAQLANPAPAAGSAVIVAVAQSSDGSVGTISLPVAIGSAISVFPLSQGGSEQFGQGGNAVNWFFF